MLTISRKNHHLIETLSVDLRRWSRVFQEFVVVQEVIFGVVVIRQGYLTQNNETQLK